MNRQRLLDRFLRYVKIDTTSSADSDTYPSTPGQLDLGKVVADEMRLLGVSSVFDEHTWNRYRNPAFQC